MVIRHKPFMQLTRAESCSGLIPRTIAVGVGAKKTPTFQPPPKSALCGIAHRAGAQEPIERCVGVILSKPCLSNIGVSQCSTRMRQTQINRSGTYTARESFASSGPGCMVCASPGGICTASSARLSVYAASCVSIIVFTF